MSHVMKHVNGWSLAVSGFGDSEPRILDIELAERLEYKRSADIRGLISRLVRDGKLNDSEVIGTVRKSTRGGRPANEYWLTESGALKVVAKSETKAADELLNEVIQVFIMARRGMLPSQPADPMQALSNPDTLRQLLGNYAERVQLLEGEVEEARPKVDIYDRIIDCGDTLGFREACKVIREGTGANETEIRNFLFKAKWIQRLGRRLAPAYYGQSKGYVTAKEREVIAGDGCPMVIPELRFTPRGVTRVVERMSRGEA